MSQGLYEPESEAQQQSTRQSQSQSATPWANFASFKHYPGAAADPRWLTITCTTGSSPALVWATWSMALEYASEREDRGSVAGFELLNVASFFRVSLDEVQLPVATFGSMRIERAFRIAPLRTVLAKLGPMQ